METFGEKLRQAIRSRGLTHELVTMVTRLDMEEIRALERNELLALPAPEVVEEGLRALARHLEIDPDEVIADFRRERELSAAASAPPAAADAPPDEAPRTAAERPEWRLAGTAGVAVPAAALLALAALGLFFWLRSPGPDRGLPGPVVRDAAATPGTRVEPPERLGTPADTAAPSPDTTARGSDPVAPIPENDRAIGAAALSIPQQGVGAGVIDRELVGEADRFTEGDQVWYWTLVEGGFPGETIHHVWLHDGEEALRVPLALGGERWRTQSYKRLNPGSAGAWVVEAQDDAGRVLARREFRCSARSRS